MKTLTALLLSLSLALLDSCLGNTPSAVAEEAWTSVIAGDDDAFVSHVYKSPNEGSLTAAAMRRLTLKALEAERSVADKLHGGFRSAEALSEEVDDEAGTAKVKLKLTYQDGYAETRTVAMRRDSEGDWKIDGGK